MIVILMGVTGTGKSTVGHALAQATGWQFADADDFHSQANRDKMHAGIPLTDEDRAPWLQSLHEQLVKWYRGSINAILACSALRESYRATLTDGISPQSISLVFLAGPEPVICQRLEARQGHYMPPSLLPSQMATLEPPCDALEISITQTIPAIVEQILGELKHKAYALNNDDQQK